MFPFYFSGVNSSMLSQNPADSINLSWNMWNARNAANSIMYMTPTFNGALFDFPEVMTFGNSLLDPRLAIQQTMNMFNNGNWMQSPWTGNNSGWFNNMFKSPWAGAADDSSKGKTDAEKAENQVKQKQYDKLKAVLKSYKENATNLSNEQEAKLETALNKGGKLDEKLDALKAVYKELDSKELRKALLAIDENKTALDKMGYNFNDTEFSYKNKADQTIKNAITKIEAELADRKYDTLQTYVPNAETNDGIMKLISYWNDEHKEEEERSIIRYIASNFPDDSAKQKNAKETVTAMTTALVNKAKEVCGRIDNCAYLEDAHEALMEQLKATKNDFKPETLKALANEFENVYARIRIAEAEELNAQLKKDYAFLNDISDKDTDFVTDSLVVDDVKADLEDEGISLSELSETLDEIEDGKGSVENNANAIQNEVNKLIKSKDLRETNCKNPPVYYSDRLKTHYVIRDGKLFKLTGVTYVYGNAVCKKSDGTKVKLSAIKGDEVSPSTLKKSSTTTGTKDSPEEVGRVLRQKLRGDTTTAEYTEIENKINTFRQYDNVEDIVKFIEGYNAEKNKKCMTWNDNLCAQISTEEDLARSKKEEYLRIIANQMLKVMDILGKSKDSEEYKDMEYYAKDAGQKDEDGNVKSWRRDGSFWRSWSFWNSKRTGAAQNMDEIIEDLIEEYREKFPKEETKNS